MISSLYDPREFISRPELPTTIEGAQEFPRWQEVILDLDELPVEEYMKPMPVNVVSGGTTPTPTPSGDTGTTYLVTFWADGALIKNVRVSGGTKVSQSDIPEAPEKAEYVFVGWNPDPETTTINANTRFDAEYVETATTDTNAYYTVIMVPSGSTFSEEGLVECNVSEFAGGKTIAFEIPLDEEYAAEYEKYSEGEITKQEWRQFLENWTATHLYMVRIIVPTNKTVTNASDGYNELAISGPTTVTVGGVEYRCYEITDEQFFPIEDVQTFNITITTA